MRSAVPGLVRLPSCSFYHYYYDNVNIYIYNGVSISMGERYRMCQNLIAPE